ncbi:hypothetical protein ACQY0O_002009 [Thecaphora frezii]
MSDRDYLAGVVCELGFFGDRQEALVWLARGAGDDEVRCKLKLAEMNGVLSVPFYNQCECADGGEAGPSRGRSPVATGVESAHNPAHAGGTLGGWMVRTGRTT